jgi:hypothetical protein
MVETHGVDLTACVYLDDPGVNLKPAREKGIITIKRLNAAQAIAELEMAPGLALQLIAGEKCCFRVGIAHSAPVSAAGFSKKSILRGLTTPIYDPLGTHFSEFLANILFRVLYRKVLFAGVRLNRADSVVRI